MGIYGLAIGKEANALGIPVLKIAPDDLVGQLADRGIQAQDAAGDRASVFVICSV
jgi:hypothetical protein